MVFRNRNRPNIKFDITDSDTKIEEVKITVFRITYNADCNLNWKIHKNNVLEPYV